MARTEITVYEKIEKHLFKSTEDAIKCLTERELEVKKRVMICVSKKMDNPLMLNSDLVNFLMNGGSGLFLPVSQSQAYNDIAGITKIVGSIQLSSKAWYRYTIVEGCKTGYQIAVEERDAAGIAANMDKIGKYTRADKEDEEFDWTQMLPPSFEPSDDVSLLENMEPIEDLETKRQEFRALFKSRLNNKAEEAVIEE